MHSFKKTIVCLLVLALIMSPALSVLAHEAHQQSENMESVINQEMLQFLIDEYGEEQAPAIFETLRALRVIDDNGNYIHHLIYLDGEGYTLDEIKQLLADGKVNLSQIAEVDGQAIRLDTLKKMMELEERLTLQELGEGLITVEHLDSLASLVRQASNEG